jgi:hypothetical protein
LLMSTCKFVFEDVAVILKGGQTYDI